MLWKKFSDHWERVLFSVFGLAFLTYSTILLLREQLSDAGIAFGIGFLAFIYANVAKFKRFKGLGFEAELWEDKQKEAADLIDRLRDVVSIYSKELIIGKVRTGRYVDGGRWQECWQLYEELLEEHRSLGQSIDFSALKKEMDDYFLCDMTQPEIDKLTKSIWDGRTQASKIITDEFGATISDLKGHRVRQTQLREASFKFDDPFDISTKADLAGQALESWRRAAKCLKLNFGVEVQVKDEVIERLEHLSKLYQNRPVEVTATLIEWSDSHE